MEVVHARRPAGASVAAGVLLVVLAASAPAALLAFALPRSWPVFARPQHLHVLLAAITAIAIMAAILWLWCRTARELEERETRLAAESALHAQAEARLRDFLGCSSDWLWETDEEHRFSYFSDGHDEIVGMPLVCRLGLRRVDLRRDDPADDDWDAHAEDLERRRPFKNFRYAYLDEAGRRRICQVSGRPVFDAEHRFRGYRGVGHDITAQYEQERALHERERQLTETQRIARVGNWRWTIGTQGVTWSREIYRMFNRDSETFTPSFDAVVAMMHPQDRDDVIAKLHRASTERTSCEYEFRALSPDGEERMIWTDATPELDDRGEVVSIFGVCQDVTEHKRIEQALRASEERFRDFAESSSDWLWEMDAELRFSYLSDRIRRAGIDPLRMIGQRGDELAGRRELDQDTWAQHLADLEAYRPFRDFVYRVDDANGAVRQLKVSGVPVFAHDGRFLGYRGTGTDITEQVLAEERVRHLAHHDGLTGLPNRVRFQDRLRQALAQAARNNRKVAVLHLDLDRFKDVNDTLGHATGDALLCEAAARLQRCVRHADTVARLGGDEFAIILTDLASSHGAARVARQVVHALAEPVEVQGQLIHTGTSIGVTVFPTDGHEPDLLLKNADLALYEAKENGRSSYSFFLPHMNQQIEDRKRTEAALRRALAHDQFVLHYQPQIRLADESIRGFEVLLRWQHPDRGLITPAEFVDVAEEAGLTVPIGEVVLRRACAQARAWLEAGHLQGRLAVNLSMAQFRRGRLARAVREILRDTGLPACHLELEITEGVLMERHREVVFETLAELHQHGVTFALDDFGTGYASLSHLKHFPVDRLKIDQSFVRDIGTDPDDAAITRAVINLGRSLELEVVAEGVETDEQLGFLRLNGCDLAQGYRFAPPLAADAALAFLIRHRARAVAASLEGAADRRPVLARAL